MGSYCGISAGRESDHDLSGRRRPAARTVYLTNFGMQQHERHAVANQSTVPSLQYGRDFGKAFQDVRMAHHVVTPKVNVERSGVRMSAAAARNWRPNQRP